MMRQFGRYLVLHKLGQGAMSAVFLARDPVLSRLVAIKVLHPDLLFHQAVVDRFFKEAKTVSRVSTPNVVQVLDFGMDGRVPYLVMEFIDGRSLQGIMDQVGGSGVPPEVAAALVLQVAEGLCATADTGIVHRDLKPENLLLNRRGLIKISDFGICHLKDHTMTATGQVLGSPRFMSPEQVMGLKPLTTHSDLFSLGAVFYYMLTGMHPFQADSLPDLYRQIAETPHKPVSELRPGLDRNLARLVDVLLEKAPPKRGQGPMQVAVMLRKYLHRRKVLDPVGSVAAYIKLLADAGLQTTSNLTPEQVKLWLGSIELDRPRRKTKHWGAKAVLFAGATAIGLALSASAYWSWSKSKVTPTSKSKTMPVESSIEKRAPQEIHTGNAVKIPGPVTSRKAAPSKENVHRLPESMDSAFLSVQSTPPFADVQLDGHDLGRTPLEGGGFPTGRHRLTLKSRMGRGLDTSIDLKAGPQTLRFVLLENPEVVDHEDAE